MIKITSISNYCSQEKLVKLATQSGFLVGGGKNHIKVKDKNGNYITGIPRHTKIKRTTTEGIIKVLIKNGADIKINT